MFTTLMKWASTLPPALLIVFSLNTSAKAEDRCFVPVCPDYNPIYYGDGRPNEASCRSNGDHPLGYLSNSVQTCPEGMTLLPNTGWCRRNACAQPYRSCTYTPLCSRFPGTFYANGWCGRNPNLLGHRIFIRDVACLPEETLIREAGLCEKCTPIAGTVSPPLSLPDLTFREAWLRSQRSASRVSTLRAGQPYKACFTVANIGTASSGELRVTGGGLATTTPPSVLLASLAPGSLRTQCLDYPAAPAPGRYRLSLSVRGSARLVEVSETNNTTTIDVTVVR